MHCPISIVIPTCERGALLARTLESLSACQLPSALHRVVVVENGGRGNAEEVVQTFTDRLPVIYDHVPSPNKSRALNHVLYRSGDELMIFFDDDVRILPTTVAVYAGAAAGRVSGFFGGRCCVDYEEEPPAWLKPYLPPSATGWPDRDIPRRLMRPGALGFNWAAFSHDLKDVCGFDEDRGPGTHSRGQETDMQERLLQAGIEGHYLPEAVVWHYVPKSRCSEEWSLQRSRQTAHFVGVNISRRRLPHRIRHEWMATAKIHALNATLAVFSTSLSPARVFQLKHRREWFRGVKEGIQQRRQPTTAASTRPEPAHATLR